MDARPAALISGRSVEWGALREALTEAAGAEVLSELILDTRLAAQCEDAGIAPDETDAAREQQVLLDQLSEDPDTALRLLDELRRRQRLGPARFGALLLRNARMRALVADDVRVTDASIGDLFDVRYGPRRRVRLFTGPDLREAESAIRAVRQGARFADYVVERSTDPSAARGGLLEPIAERDPSYPVALRRAVWALEDGGALTAPIPIETGYAVLQFLDEVPGDDDVTIDDVRDELARDVRRAQERLLMERLATSILRDARLTIFDDALHGAWRRAQPTSRTP